VQCEPVHDVYRLELFFLVLFAVSICSSM
jgi:hypothetical protein